jgi:hypothetical protein
MMVYSFYERYEVNKLQRLVLKGSVFSIAFLQFVALYSRSGLSESMNPDTTLTPLGLPGSFKIVSVILASAFFGLAVLSVFVTNYVKHKRLPPVNFAIAWVAFYVWWVPAIFMPEFALAVPFFHSLQYLPFAYRVERRSFLARNRSAYFGLTVKLLVLFACGILAFEVIPTLLDSSLETATQKGPMFFLQAFAVFINIHHFFIDSVIWKFGDHDIRDNLLHDEATLLEEPHVNGRENSARSA